MANPFHQPALKLIDYKETNLIQVETPAIVRFECTVKLPKTNKFYKKLHEVTALQFASKLIGLDGGQNSAQADIRLFNETEINELERQISEIVSNPISLRSYNLLYLPRVIATPRLEVETIEPIIEQDQSSPFKFKSLFKLISKPYLLKEYVGKGEYSEDYLYAQESRLDAFQKGRKVKFDKLSVVPIWAKVNEAQLI